MYKFDFKLPERWRTYLQWVIKSTMKKYWNKRSWFRTRAELVEDSDASLNKWKGREFALHEGESIYSACHFPIAVTNFTYLNGSIKPDFIYFYGFSYFILHASVFWSLAFMYTSGGCSQMRVGVPETRVTDDCEQPRTFWGLSLCCLQE